jgi:hypothetical protein
MTVEEDGISNRKSAANKLAQLLADTPCHVGKILRFTRHVDGVGGPQDFAQPFAHAARTGLSNSNPSRRGCLEQLLLRGKWNFSDATRCGTP